ncbi:MAG: hypothetical protein GY898_22905 [Proteobacteria bacterium]|nr:hypothetical protein [Pseudomonadota bacterium]
MAIVLDGRVNSAPVIQEAICGGVASITMGGAGASGSVEAADLAVILRAGALPAPITVRSQREVAPAP